MAKQLFGTDGIRGRANQYPMIPELAMRLGRALPRVMGQGDKRQAGKGQASRFHKVLIGRDTRASGEMLEYALCAGLISEGVDVYLVGEVPTPAVAYLTRTLGCDAGIMLTASHNPHTDNGIKVFGADGYKLDDATEQQLEDILLSTDALESENISELGKVIPMEDASARYIEFAKKAVGSIQLEGLKIILDCAHGAAYRAGVILLEELGAEVIPLGVEPNGVNINEGLGAMHPERAAELVKTEGAHLGVCLDGDADRLIFIDHEGVVISGDRVLCLSALALSEKGQLRGQTLVATVMSNLGLKVALEKQGIKVVSTAVGDRHVIECMREHGYSLGGENSGHVIFSDYASTGDGLMSALMVMAMMQESGKTLHELADCMEEFPQELIALNVREKPALEEVPEIIQAIAIAEQALGDRGRVLVRYSGTEAKIRVLVEAKESQMAKQQAELICRAVTATIGSEAVGV